MKKILLCLSLFLATSIFAEWDPEFCFSHLPEKGFKKLQSTNFQKLKVTVKNALKKSWCSEEKIDLLMELTALFEPKICVEIGAFTGSSVLPVALTLKQIKNGKIFAIDAWSNSVAIRNLDADDPNREWWSKVNMKDAYKTFLNTIKIWGINSFCTPVFLTSEEAIYKIKDIDFLHIDGDYSEKGSFNDVILYLPNVKAGGFILFSGLHTQINGSYPKLNAFSKLLDFCEIICEIEQENTVLLRKR